MALFVFTAVFLPEAKLPIATSLPGNGVTMRQVSVLLEVGVWGCVCDRLTTACFYQTLVTKGVE